MKTLRKNQKKIVVSWWKRDFYYGDAETHKEEKRFLLSKSDDAVEFARTLEKDETISDVEIWGMGKF